MLQQLRTASMLVILFTVLTGALYPAIVTGLAQALFPWRANGSLIAKDGAYVGSELIGQAFNDPKYFWGRPSSTMPFPYNAMSSAGSNLSPANPVFLESVSDRALALRRSIDKGYPHLIPVDLVTASGSGLDPEISPLSAFFQVPRIAKARSIPESELLELIDSLIVGRTFGILGEPRVNVLRLNVALEKHHPHLQTVP